MSISLPTAAAFLLLILAPSCARGDASSLDSLAGAWNDLDGFASLGQCIASPKDSQYYQCSPAQLARVEKERFEGRGTVSATDSVLSIGDSLRNKEINSAQVNSLFRDYNYSDLLMTVDLSYIAHNFIFGIRPLRYQGQFEVHNPNLPLVSLAFREDQNVHAGYAKSFGNDHVRFSVGAIGSIVFREETLLEASLIDVASTPASQLLDRQRLRGYFFDVGGMAEFNDLFIVSLLGQDLGDWFGGQMDHTDRYVFLRPDKVPKVFAAVSVLPALASGRLQVGLSGFRFLGQQNLINQQWFGTVSYYVGPLRVITGWRPELFRTGLAIRFSRFEVNVAQEWVNKIESDRKAQQRFSLEVTSGL